MKNTILIASSIFLLMAGCAPQAELMRTQGDVSDLQAQLNAARTRIQELQKNMESLSAGMRGTGDVQKSIADYGVKFDQLSTDLHLLQGRLEENNFKIAELAQKLDDKTFKISELSARVEELEARVKSLSSVPPAAAPAAPAPQPAVPEQEPKKAVERTPEPSEVYRQAKSDYDRGNFDLSLAGFHNYLDKFPGAILADSAQYWIGECYYAQKDYYKAIEAFSKVSRLYPKSDKAAGAKLKIGYSHLNKNNKTKAKQWLNKVIREHKGSREADLAQEKYKKIK